MQLQFFIFYFSEFFGYAVTVFFIFHNYLVMQLQFLFFAGINSAQVFCGRVFVLH